MSTIHYTVRPGDSLWSIARKFNTTVDDIAQANNVGNADVLSPGQLLRVPVPVSSVPSMPAPAPAPTPMPMPMPMPMPTSIPTPVHMPTPGATIQYTVRPGDTLWQLAQRYNTTVNDIARYNGIVELDELISGQQLRIRVSGGASTGVVPPVTPPLPGAIILHTVRPGDTLWLLSQRYNTTINEIARLNGILDPDVLTPGQQLRILVGGSASTGVVPPVNPPQPGDTITHTVRPGDTLWLLAQRYNTTVNDIARLNNINSDDELIPGQQLRIRVGSGAPTGSAPTESVPPATPLPGTVITYTVRPGDTLWQLAQRYNTTINEIARLNNINSDDELIPGQQLRIRVGSGAPTGVIPPVTPSLPATPQKIPAWYTVRPGDTLEDIAKRFGAALDLLKFLNSIGNPKLIYPGQRLRIRP